MKEEIIYEIKFKKNSSAIIEYKQIEFMANVFDLVKVSKLNMDEIVITKTDRNDIERKYKEACDLLSELVDLVEDHLEGSYKIDFFTLQLAQTFLGRDRNEND